MALINESGLLNTRSGQIHLCATLYKQQNHQFIHIPHITHYGNSGNHNRQHLNLQKSIEAGDKISLFYCISGRYSETYSRYYNTLGPSLAWWFMQETLLVLYLVGPICYARIYGIDCYRNNLKDNNDSYSGLSQEKDNKKWKTLEV